ncbi:hypothetical protein JAAARDRAFT_201069 [Jaapia argillacea MUCL 33604]|uniref:Uncharacterized protein n=1 Tax=Jaapia argillacea MUCL 33604 TaxID=933084 RepID=A0A067P2Q5_9AGAM|nr:hypothetical protein JAAARDRAFT_201069 [Jaapia argillacea MUCL 33604]
MDEKPHPHRIYEAHDAAFALRFDMESYYKPLKLVTEHMGFVLSVFGKIGDIHVVLQAACELLTAAYKALEVQRQRDEHVVALATAMARLFAWSREVKQLKDQLHSLKDTVKKMVDHAHVCATFILEYIKHGFLHRMIHGRDSKLAELIRECTDLRGTFLVDLEVANLLKVDRLEQRQVFRYNTGFLSGDEDSEDDDEDDGLRHHMGSPLQAPDGLSEFPYHSREWARSMTSSRRLAIPLSPSPIFQQ